MTRPAPVVAELGRAETPGETAERKATASRIYRSSQNARNLIAALLVTLAVVAVIVFAVPRGEPEAPPPIDVARIAADVETSVRRPALIPLSAGWRVNAAELEGGSPLVWNVTLAPEAEDERGFIRVAQAFGTDVTWAPQRLNGVAPTDTERIGDRDWDVYRIRDSRSSGNVSYALGTQAGADYVLLYGSRTPESTAQLAESLLPQLRRISEAP